LRPKRDRAERSPLKTVSHPELASPAKPSMLPQDVFAQPRPRGDIRGADLRGGTRLGLLYSAPHPRSFIGGGSTKPRLSLEPCAAKSQLTSSSTDCSCATGSSPVTAVAAITSQQLFKANSREPETACGSAVGNTLAASAASGTVGDRAARPFTRSSG